MTDDNPETPTNALAAALGRRKVLLLDGGMGSLLIGMGLAHGQAPDAWNLEHADRIAGAHQQYVEAGSDIIHTNSFGATPPKLKAAGLEGKCVDINAAAVALARRACEASPDTLVAGDVGPTGELFPPMGTADAEGLEQAFDEQMQALANAGADLISIETMFDLREARAAVAAAKRTGLPVIASMTFDQKPRGFFTIVGDKIGAALGSLRDDGADAVGFNCSVQCEPMLGMVREAAAALPDAWLSAQPNAGQPRPTPAGVVYDADPEAFAADLVAMVRAGARIVGGCCGTDPEFIRVARRALDQHLRS